MSEKKKLVVVVTNGFNDERSSVAWSDCVDSSAVTGKDAGASHLGPGNFENFLTN